MCSKTMAEAMNANIFLYTRFFLLRKSYISLWYATKIQEYFLSPK